MHLEIRKITEEELPIFSSILLEASNWVIQKGEEMWDEQNIAPKGLIKNYALDEMYLAFSHDEPIATVILQEVDYIYWPNEQDKNALYLHKLAVRRKAAQLGISTHILEWAKHITKNQQKSFLRLDCMADRVKLCQLYERQGFIKLREEKVNSHIAALYEYPVK